MNKSIPNFDFPIPEHCPSFTIHGLQNDNSELGLKIRANFTMERSQINLGEIISQSVELKYTDKNGHIQKVECDNCVWSNESISANTEDFEGLIGPLDR